MRRISMMKNSKKYSLLMALLAIICFMAGCSQNKTENLLSQSQSAAKPTVIELDTYNAEVTDFGVRLFQESFEQENTLISPLSVMSALTMTANGADNETLEQMEAVFGLPVEDLNNYLYTYANNLPQKKTYQMKLANSIWFTDEEGFEVNQEFLETNGAFYDAQFYQATFDKSTKNEINDWVKDKTDGMIPTILDKIPEDAVMYLINALAFEAEWEDIYDEYQVRDRIFTLENGTEKEIELMYSDENRYLEDEYETGFIKNYMDGKYAFAALLPKDDISVQEYVDSLTGEHLQELLSNAQEVQVSAAIPKFEMEYDIEMSDILVQMGMGDAFDAELADFSRLGQSDVGNIFINRVLHKTYIEVAEQGTKAGAATVVEMSAKEGAAPVEEIKEVHLDRPFVYMLIDCENHMPFLIGAVMDIGV
ncbi:MAG: serpin family protein [Ruminococcus sp.]|nr:serpin family protein [Ruminococcus sp.]